MRTEKKQKKNETESTIYHCWVERARVYVAKVSRGRSKSMPDVGHCCRSHRQLPHRWQLLDERTRSGGHQPNARQKKQLDSPPQKNETEQKEKKKKY